MSIAYELLKPPRISEELFSTIGYFLPRLMFLQSAHAAQVHWGDIVLALDQFPKQKYDLSLETFWEQWMISWKELGDQYLEKSLNVIFPSNKKRLLRSAAGCYHWAEFMYFTDSNSKTNLRKKIRDCFDESIIHEKFVNKSGLISWNGYDVPYRLLFPPSPPPHPCIILTNGLDSVTEYEICSFAEQFLSLGIATFIFDGPGQGINLGVSPLSMQFELIIEEILILLEKQPEIKMDSLGFFGVSFGGYLALRIAKWLGEYFKGVVNLSGGPSISPFISLKRRLKTDFAYAFMETESNMQAVFDDLHIDNFSHSKTNILSIHGGLDDIFPIDRIKKMHLSLGTQHQLILYPSEAHVCLNYLNQYIIAINEWFGKILGKHL